MHTIDHLFVFCRAGAPEAAQLTSRGLDIGVRRQHHGQGTANVCFGYGDGYLELLWLDDEQAARDAMVKPLGLHERARWREHNASPFGICLRPTTPGTPPPFPSWDYRPRYLPADLSLPMACNSGVLGEPLLFAIDRPFVPLPQRHTLARRRLTRATLTVRELAPMSLLHDLHVPALVVQDGDAPGLVLEFEGGGETLDLSPALPLRLLW